MANVNNLIGKKAIIKSLEGATAMGFEIGDVVTVKEHYNADVRYKRVALQKGDTRGYIDAEHLELVNEDEGGIVKVEMEGFKAEGTVADIMELVKQMHAFTQALEAKSAKPAKQKPFGKLKVGDVAYIAPDRGEKNCLHGFKDGAKVVITDVGAVPSYPYTVKIEGVAGRGYASNADLLI